MFRVNSIEITLILYKILHDLCVLNIRGLFMWAIDSLKI